MEKNRQKKLIIADTWKDFELLDCGDGERLEKWGKFILIRPDPAAGILKKNKELWAKYDARFRLISRKKGEWQIKTQLPDFWTVSYNNATFKVRLTATRQVGLFPEQASNWDWLSALIRRAGRNVRVLNLFAYTGGATVAAAASGASVCHVDSSKTAVAWCRENTYLSGLGKHSIRYIVDDCKKFLDREFKRGRKYDAVIMDPPAFGHGAKGEIWKIEHDFTELLTKCVKILSENPLFLVINCYAGEVPEKAVLQSVAELIKPWGGFIQYGEICLQVKNRDKFLSCGKYCRWAAC